jgi:glycosyltransferase involved in cell wall biosynthesis
VRVRVIIPARNEAGTIGATVRAAKDIPQVTGVVVVDDGSSDSTGQEARLAGAEVRRAPRRLGKGGALSLGLRDLTEDAVLLIDGDLGTEARGAGAILEPLVAGEADMCVGQVRGLGPGGLGVARGIASWGLRLLTGKTLAFPLSGQRALTKELVTAVTPLSRGFGVEVGLTVDAIRRGFRVVEVPTPIRHRNTGRDLPGFRHRAGQCWDIILVFASRGLLRWFKP